MPIRAEEARPLRRAENRDGSEYEGWMRCDDPNFAPQAPTALASRRHGSRQRRPLPFHQTSNADDLPAR